MNIVSLVPWSLHFVSRLLLRFWPIGIFGRLSRLFDVVQIAFSLLKTSLVQSIRKLFWSLLPKLVPSMTALVKMSLFGNKIVMSASNRLKCFTLCNSSIRFFSTSWCWWRRWAINLATSWKFMSGHFVQLKRCLQVATCCTICKGESKILAGQHPGMNEHEPMWSRHKLFTTSSLKHSPFECFRL